MNSKEMIKIDKDSNSLVKDRNLVNNFLEQTKQDLNSKELKYILHNNLNEKIINFIKFSSEKLTNIFEKMTRKSFSKNQNLPKKILEENLREKRVSQRGKNIYYF